MRRSLLVVADAVPIFRVAVRNLVTRESGFEVVEARNVEELRAAAASAQPDIALVDLDLPPLGALDAVRSLAASGSTKTIVWRCDPDGQTVRRAMRAGAVGYLDKGVSPGELLGALRGVPNGELPLDGPLRLRLIETLQQLETRDRAQLRSAELSPREREVLDLVASGARNKQIAAALTISEFTVKRHVQNILHKLELPSRRAAASLYRSAQAFDEVLPA